MTGPIVYILDEGAEWTGDEDSFKGWTLDKLSKQLHYVLNDLELQESRPEWEPSIEWARCLRNQRYWLLSEIERRKA